MRECVDEEDGYVGRREGRVVGWLSGQEMRGGSGSMNERREVGRREGKTREEREHRLRVLESKGREVEFS